MSHPPEMRLHFRTVDGLEFFWPMLESNTSVTWFGTVGDCHFALAANGMTQTIPMRNLVSCRSVMPDTPVPSGEQISEEKAMQGADVPQEVRDAQMEQAKAEGWRFVTREQGGKTWLYDTLADAREEVPWSDTLDRMLLLANNGHVAELRRKTEPQPVMKATLTDQSEHDDIVFTAEEYNELVAAGVYAPIALAVVQREDGVQYRIEPDEGKMRLRRAVLEIETEGEQRSFDMKLSADRVKTV